MDANGEDPDLARAYEDLLQFVYLAPVGVIKFNAAGGIEMMNPMAAQVLMPLVAGGGLDDVYAIFRLWLPDLRERVAACGAEPGIFLEKPRVDVDPGASDQILSLTFARVADDAFMAIVQDVTLAARNERRLFEEEQRLRAIFDQIRDYAIYTVDTNGRIVGWNKSLYRLGGWESADVAGKHVSMFVPPGKVDPQAAELVFKRAATGGSVRVEGERVRKDGSVYWGDTVITALHDKAGGVIGYVVVSRDMSERKSREDELVRLATTDVLTGAYNRRYGMERLKEAFARFKRYATPASVLMIDVDHFKRINDTHGHAAGDAVLRDVAATLRAGTREVDMVARWGGEEFLVLLPDTNAAGAAVAAERLLRAIRAAAVQVDDARIVYTASIGIATLALDQANVEAAINLADAALYAAKTGGRDRAVGP